MLFVTAAEARVISRATHTNASAIGTVLQMETGIIPGRISASYLSLLSPRKRIIPNHTFTRWALLPLPVCLPFWLSSALAQRFLTACPGPGSQKTRTPCAFKPSAPAVPNPRAQSRWAPIRAGYVHNYLLVPASLCPPPGPPGGAGGTAAPRRSLTG